MKIMQTIAPVKGFGASRAHSTRQTKSHALPKKGSEPSVAELALSNDGLTYEEKRRLIGSKTKQQQQLEKDKERELRQFGAIPEGPMRERAQGELEDVKSDPLPVDLVDAFAWATEKGLSHTYIRNLIKTREGSLPLVGNTLQYSSEGLNSLWRHDIQDRREKGIKKSAAARFRAEEQKLAIAELESLRTSFAVEQQVNQEKLRDTEVERNTLANGMLQADARQKGIMKELAKINDENVRLQKTIESLEAQLGSETPGTKKQ